MENRLAALNVPAYTLCEKQTEYVHFIKTSWFKNIRRVMNTFLMR